MYQNIIVPIVFNHKPAVEDSIEIAEALLSKDGTMTLLHIVEELPGYVELHLPRETQLIKIAETKAKMTEIAKINSKNVKPVVIEGHASRSILDYAKNNSADCIIIASHKPGLEDYLIGSTAARVVRHAKCAVHVLR